MGSDYGFLRFDVSVLLARAGQQISDRGFGHSPNFE